MSFHLFTPGKAPLQGCINRKNPDAPLFVTTTADTGAILGTVCQSGEFRLLGSSSLQCRKIFGNHSKSTHPGRPVKSMDMKAAAVTPLNFLPTAGGEYQLKQRPL